MRKEILLLIGMWLFVGCGTETKTVEVPVYSEVTTTVYSDPTATVSVGNLGSYTAGAISDIYWSGTLTGGYDISYLVKVYASPESGTTTLTGEWDNQSLVYDAEKNRYHVDDITATKTDLSGSERTSSVQIAAALPAGNYAWEIELTYSSSTGVDVVMASDKSEVFYLYEGSSVQSPLVKTKLAVSTSSSATLYGKVDPNGSTATVWFEYGVTDSLGSVSESQNASGAVEITSGITGLSAGTTYYYRFVATNSLGTSYGNILTFSTTPATPAP